LPDDSTLISYQRSRRPPSAVFFCWMFLDIATQQHRNEPVQFGGITRLVR
jgi:hypothetical protein